jgi:hypothetical protein
MYIKIANQTSNQLFVKILETVRIHELSGFGKLSMTRTSTKGPKDKRLILHLTSTDTAGILLTFLPWVYL